MSTKIILTETEALYLNNLKERAIEAVNVFTKGIYATDALHVSILLMKHIDAIDGEVIINDTN